MIMANQQSYHMRSFYMQNKSSDNPIASLKLRVHSFCSSGKCRPPNLSGEAGNVLILLNSLLLSNRVTFTKLYPLFTFSSASKAVSLH